MSIEKILKRIERIDYTTEHGLMDKEYAVAYNDALEWVLDIVFDFQMPRGTTSPVNQSSKESANNEV